MVFVSPFTMTFQDLYKHVCDLVFKSEFMEICVKISFPSFFRKMLMSAFLLKFKANYLEKMHGYPSFSLWIPIALSKIYFYCVVLTWHKILCI